MPHPKRTRQPTKANPAEILLNLMLCEGWKETHLCCGCGRPLSGKAWRRGGKWVRTDTCQSCRSPFFHVLCPDCKGWEPDTLCPAQRP